MQTNLPSVIDYSDPKMVRTLKATVAKDLTDEEFVLFAEHCKATGLNPFKKEVWAIKAGGRLQCMTGIGGFLEIANRHPQFDGMEIDVETNAEGFPLKAICKVYRKDRKFPSVGIALMREFSKGTPIWKQMPSVMLTKCAKSIALREAFPQELNGMYTAEEMPAEYSEPETRATVLPAEKPTKQAKKQVEEDMPGDFAGDVPAFIENLPVYVYDFRCIDNKFTRQKYEARMREKGAQEENGCFLIPERIGKLEEYLVHTIEPSAKQAGIDLVATLQSADEISRQA